MARKEMTAADQGVLLEKNNWSAITNITERRRIQNRIAQRNYRLRLKQQQQQLQQEGSRPVGQTLHDVADLDVSRSNNRSVLRTNPSLEELQARKQPSTKNRKPRKRHSQPPISSSVLTPDKTLNCELLTQTTDTVGSDWAVTALHASAGKGNRAVVELLLAKGIPIDSVNSSGMSALAVVQEQPEMAQLLLERGAIVDIRDCTGMTPLHYAVEQPSVDILRLLLHSNADTGIKNHRGQSPLRMAAESGFINMMEEILKE